MSTEKRQSKESEIKILEERLAEAEGELTSRRLRASEASDAEKKAAQTMLQNQKDKVSGLTSRLKGLKEHISATELKDFQTSQPIHFACWQAIQLTTERPERLHNIVEYLKKSIPDTVDSRSDPKKNTLLTHVATPEKSYQLVRKNTQDEVVTHTFKNSVNPADFARLWTSKADMAAAQFAKEVAYCSNINSSHQNNLMKYRVIPLIAIYNNSLQ